MIDCVIPIRSGSVGIKNKNIKKINGVPLICNSIEIALKSKIFNRIIIAVDSIKYMKIISKYFVDMKKKKLFCIKGQKSSTGKAMTEVVLKEVINNFPKLVSLFYNVSPLLSYVDLKNLNFLIKVLTVFLGILSNSLSGKKKQNVKQLIINFQKTYKTKT